jgi:acetoin utilization deacetylase AcuC-like enzyme
LQEKHSGNQNHVENPERIKYILKYLQSQNKTYRYIDYLEINEKQINNSIQSSLFLNQIHNCYYCTFEYSLKERYCPICNMSNNKNEIYKFVSETEGDSTYKTEFTDLVIERIKLMIIKGINYIIDPSSNNIREIFIASRPPGHHSCGYEKKTNPRGFCHTNFISFAANEITNKYSKTVAIFDFDAHHGDGTEQCLSEMQNPMIKGFVSMHIWGDNIYPFSGEHSQLDYCTPILNIPIHKSIKCDDDYYINLLETKIKKFLLDINPDILLISAGFDAHKDDTLKLMNITEISYKYIGNMLRSINKPIIYILEGGYNPDILANSVCSILDK